jgi:hypothetical protein
MLWFLSFNIYDIFHVRDTEVVICIILILLKNDFIIDLLYVNIDFSVLSQYVIICQENSKTSTLSSLDNVSLIDALKSRYPFGVSRFSYVYTNTYCILFVNMGGRR